MSMKETRVAVSFAPSADVMIVPAFGSFLLVFKHGVKVTHRFLFICSFFLNIKHKSLQLCFFFHHRLIFRHGLSCLNTVISDDAS